MRERKQHTRREIQSYKPDVRRLLQFGTELDLMQYLRGIGIFDEDPRFAKAVNAYRALKKGKL
ncbi:MAG: hypothetical protein WB716_05480 [Candidatus Acidiferrales bacterium]